MLELQNRIEKSSQDWFVLFGRKQLDEREVDDRTDPELHPFIPLILLFAITRQLLDG
jgi:hypothetical protein